MLVRTLLKISILYMHKDMILNYFLVRAMLVEWIMILKKSSMTSNMSQKRVTKIIRKEVH